MELTATVYQFFSRTNIPNISIGSWKWRPNPRPDILIEVKYCICDKPFEINFADLIGQRPSIGAFQYIDPVIDKFMSKRWPKCIKGEAKITSTSSDLEENGILKQILIDLRYLIWDIKARPECPKIIQENIDQIATTKGYRRQYFARQLFDCDGNRVPSSKEKYFPSNVGDYTGPGVASILDINPFKNINEFAWSSIIPFPNGINATKDDPIIKNKVEATRTHRNSYDELEASINYFKKGDIKASIRFAASSVDAILRYYCVAWEIKFPKGNQPFDEKIEILLFNASKPSYKKADQENLIRLSVLYRARNSMHEGDCYYRNESGAIVYITNTSQVDDLIRAAECFTLWIDALT